jgi:hypothetical protein
MSALVPVLLSTVSDVARSVGDASVVAVEQSIRLVLPQGGQGTARRNAWIAMGENAVRARERYELARILESTPGESRQASTV